MSKIIGKEKIGKVNYAWVQVGDKEARLIKYDDDAKALVKGDALAKMIKRVKEIKKLLQTK